MPLYVLNQAESATSVYVDGQEVASYRQIEQRPLIATPLRDRNLNTAVLSGEKAKLARARKHLQELVVLIHEYLTRTPFSFSEQGDSLVGKISEPIPTDINVVLGDVVHNLRAALDLMICDLVRANGSQPTRDSAMPIVIGGVKPSHLAKQLAGVSARGHKFLRRLTHNVRWNDALLVLHGLDIMDKHNSLVAVGAATVRVHASVGIPGLFLGPDGSMRIVGPGPGGKPLLRPAGSPTSFNVVFLTNEQAEVYRYVPDIPQEVAVQCELVFGPGEKGGGLPIVQTLDVLAQVVERILVLCERRAL